MTDEVTAHDLASWINRHTIPLLSHSGRGYSRALTYHVGTGRFTVTDHGQEVADVPVADLALQAYYAIQPRSESR